MSDSLPDPDAQPPSEERVDLPNDLHSTMPDEEADFAASFQRLAQSSWDTEAAAGADENDWPAEDLESAYRRALKANDAVEWDFSHYAGESAVQDGTEGSQSAGFSDESDGDAGGPAATGGVASESANTEAASDPDNLSSVQRTSDVPPQRIRMAQVVEAALFVGGEPLTSKRLCYMLKGDYDLDAIEQAIEELNRKYIDEGRPYEIRLGEGGYRVVLRDEFNSVRNRVFGIGPREVKLSQDALEVLALVAYRQPITQEEIAALGKSNPGSVLRQLLRRQLIELVRDAQDRKRVTYSTTRRFLSVFGIGSIDELPQADELAFK
ncbi:hypothetical protein GC176_12855 [bacterium]|nr:hypothetical protein [bacterium]